MQICRSFLFALTQLQMIFLGIKKKAPNSAKTLVMWEK